MPLTADEAILQCIDTNKFALYAFVIATLLSRVNPGILSFVLVNATG